MRERGRQWLERRHPLIAVHLKRWLHVRETFPSGTRLRPAGELVGGRTVVQQFTCPANGLSGLAVSIGTFGRTNRSTLVLRVYEEVATRTRWIRARTLRLVFEREFDTASFPDGSRVAAYFPEIVNSCRRSFVVTLGAEGAAPGNAVTVWLEPRGASFGTLYIGTAVSIDTQIACELRYSAALMDASTASAPERTILPTGCEPMRTPELSRESQLVQTFVAEGDWLSGASIRLSRATADESCEGRLGVRLLDVSDTPPALIADRSFETRLIAEGEDLEVRFPGVARSRGRRFALALSSAATMGSGAHAWLHGRRDPCERLSIGGEHSTHLALTFNPRYSPPDAASDYPDAILWSPVTRCNLNCRHCISRDTRAEGIHHLSQRVREEIRALCRAGIITRIATDYSGDLLFNEAKYGTLTELLGFDVDFVLDTHGTVMTDEIAARLLSSRLRRINFSLDAALPETYAWVRRGSRPLEQVLANVRLFAGAWRRASVTHTAELTLSFTLMRRTVDETLRFIELASDIGATTVAFRHLEVYTDDMSCESLYFDQARWNDARAAILKRAGELGVIVTVPPPFDNRPHRSGHRHCPVPWESVAILGNGDVMACCVPTAVIGNLNEESLRDIWTGRRYREFRRRVNSETPPAVCSVCPPFGLANNRYSYLFTERRPSLLPLRTELDRH